jgi:DNA-binding cell septation regulator SpoVG
MKIENFKTFEKNSLRGFFDAILTSGMILRGCSLFEKNGARWVGLPSKKFTDRNGVESYQAIIEFVDRDRANDFRDACVDAVDKWLAEQAPTAKQSPGEITDEIPF